MEDVLKEVILESVAKLKKLQSNRGKEVEDVKEVVEEEKKQEEPVVLPYKTMSVGQSPISNLIVGDITGVEVDVTKKQETEGEGQVQAEAQVQADAQVQAQELDVKVGGNPLTEAMVKGKDGLLAKTTEMANGASALMSVAKKGVDALASATNTSFAIPEPALGPGAGTGSKHSDCCPLLDDNLLAMLKGIFTVDLLKGFYKEGAQLTVDKINEQLSDVTKEPAVVKQEIYDKILEVFRAHLTSEEGRKMIFEYIDTIMKANIEQLTEEKEIAKQGFISILKHGSPEIKDIFESALDRALANKSINKLEEVNKTNIGDITESMKTEIKGFVTEKYKKNTGIVEPSAPVMVQADATLVENAIPVTYATLDATLDAKQDATLVTQAVATEVVQQDAQADAMQVATTDATPVATEVVQQDATANAMPVATLVTTSVATPVKETDATQVATNSGGAKKQKRFTKKNKRFTKKQKRSRQTKRRQTKRRVNKSGRVRIHK
jgi:hypothetical protein